jgi:hypothetical protein
VSFDEGDWNFDGRFHLSDLVADFQAGHCVAEAAALDGPLAAAVDVTFAEGKVVRRSPALAA